MNLALDLHTSNYFHMLESPELLFENNYEYFTSSTAANSTDGRISKFPGKYQNYALIPDVFYQSHKRQQT